MEVHLNIDKPTLMYHSSNDNQIQSNAFLTKANLRANHLSGSIVLGNHEHLIELDISENSIEVLDLSALNNLKLLRCSKNKLKQIIVNGRVLTSLIAGNNELTKLKVQPIPDNLTHLDVSYNKLNELPDWIGFCTKLRTIFASNNNIMSLPEHLFCNKNSVLEIIQLEYNKLSKLPPMPTKPIRLQELFLQRNQLEELPMNFFIACKQLILLNISSNKLMTLPLPLNTFSNMTNSTDSTSAFALERLYATNNKLTNDIFNIIKYLKQLRVLHIGYNELTQIPNETFTQQWSQLEELIVSGNKLQTLPENLIINCENLKILRVHSNKLCKIPLLGQLQMLKVLDLSHNELENINLKLIVPKRLQLLDLSFNKKIESELKQLQVQIPTRRMNLINVCEQNKSDLLKFLNLYKRKANAIRGHWVIGFSETAGNLKKLYIEQLRSTYFCDNEGLFGMFDGECIRVLPIAMAERIKKYLHAERQNDDTTITDYLKYTLLSAYKEQMQNGLINGISSIICHISLDEKKTPSIIIPSSMNHQHHHTPNNMGTPPKLILRTASVGEIMAILIRRSGIVHLTPSIANININKSSADDTTPNNDNKTNNNNNNNVYIPNPELSEIILGEHDEYLVIINRNILKIMNSDAIANEIRMVNNIVLAAKRIQDIAQSYGAEENLSIIIVKFYIRSEKFNLLKTNQQNFLDYSSTQSLDSDKLRTIHHHHHHQQQNAQPSSKCKCKHNHMNEITDDDEYPFHFIRNHTINKSNGGGGGGAGGDGSASLIQNPINNSSRNNNSSQNSSSLSSSSNQSTIGIYKKIKMPLNNSTNNNNNNNDNDNCINITNNKNIINTKNYDILNAIQKTIIKDENMQKYLLEIEEAIEDSDIISDEQYKCWEYMLEKNTQLLFDKELNTLTKNQKLIDTGSGLNPLNKKQPAITNGHHQLFTLNRALSLSSPQLSTSSTAKIISSHLTDDADPSTNPNNPYDLKKQLLLQQQKLLSPQQQSSIYHNHDSSTIQTKPKIPFLSKHFGSDRIYNKSTDNKLSSFHRFNINNNNGAGGSTRTTTTNSNSSIIGGVGRGGGRGGNKINSLREPNIFGGPNAAYFGSLQRLMPYNLEYDFNVIHERYLEDSIIEADDHRMRQYWGIATSEL